MSIHPRSVLRPEYLSSLQLRPPRNKALGVKRLNTNTAPVYSTDNPCPQRRRTTRRSYNHPHLKFTAKRTLPRSNIPNQIHLPDEHPALRCSASTIPVRSTCKIKNASNSYISNYLLKCSVHSCGYENEVNHTFIDPDILDTGKSCSHGQAEQLRRSRESNTFALIDSQFSRAPLSQIRDMYIQTRNSNNSVVISASRTTKKVNLSVVHTILRSRIRDNLRELHDHMNRCLDALFSKMFSDYRVELRHELACKLYGISCLPCSKDCPFCPDILFRDNNNRSCLENFDASDHMLQSSITPPPIIQHVQASSPNDSGTPMLSSSDCMSDYRDCSPVDIANTEFGHCFSSDPVPDFYTVPNGSPMSPKIKPESPSVVSMHDSMLEKPLPSYHVSCGSADFKHSSRQRLDSLTLRIVDDFVNNDWCNGDIDTTPYSEDPVDLHTMISDSDCLSMFDPAYESHDLYHFYSDRSFCLATTNP